MFPKVKFNRNQLIFIVQVMIASVFDTIQDSFQGRWMDGRHDVEWEKINAEAKQNIKLGEMVRALIYNLSYNLSILAAQVTGEGMGNCDALDMPLPEGKLDTLIETWSKDWVDGKRGIIPSKEGEQGVGRYDVPSDEALATHWVDLAFDEYLKDPLPMAKL